ncbi:MAG: NAD-binding protein [Phycisphaeraceae bacterium]|nr:NAD-binding protein [Phycisphaeraceae bacterium]
MTIPALQGFGGSFRRFGSRLAEQLAFAGMDVIAVDRDLALVQQMRDKVILAVALDATDEAVLRAQGINAVNVAIVGMCEARPRRRHKRK